MHFLIAMNKIIASTIMKDILCFLSPPGQIDPFASGIWSKKPVKFAVFLWRIRCGLINSFMVLRQWGIPTPDYCVLCEEEIKSTSHIFFNCNCSREVPLEVSQAVVNAWWRKSFTIPQSRGGDIRLLWASDGWSLLWALLGLRSYCSTPMAG